MPEQVIKIRGRREEKREKGKKGRGKGREELVSGFQLRNSE